jgi:hypothetical protein
MATYQTMASMMGQGTNGATASVPTQTFNAANILGTPVPQVGDNKARPNYGAAIGGTPPKHIVIAAIVVFTIGYVLYHINFEK